VEQLDRVKLQIQPHTQDLTRTELDIIAKAFTDNTVRKYLQIVLMNQITDHANIPLPVLAENLTTAAIKQAFVKGGISVIHTLLSIEESPQQPAAPLKA
jgi:hypothetical protein